MPGPTGAHVQVPRSTLPVGEFALLENLMRRAGQVIAKNDLLSEVWDFAFDGEANVVGVYIGFVDLDELIVDAVRSIRARDRVEVDGSGIAGDASRARRRVGFVVSDDGPGIPDEDRTRVFDG